MYLSLLNVILRLAAQLLRSSTLNAVSLSYPSGLIDMPVTSCIYCSNKILPASRLQFRNENFTLASAKSSWSIQSHLNHWLCRNACSHDIRKHSALTTPSITERSVKYISHLAVRCHQQNTEMIAILSSSSDGSSTQQISTQKHLRPSITVHSS